MSLTNCVAAAAQSPVEKVPEKDDNYSMANTFLKYALAAGIGNYLFVAVLSGDWTLPEDVRQVCILVWSLGISFFIGFIGMLKGAESEGKVRQRSFWCVVGLEFAWGTACWFIQPYMGEPTFLGNSATGIPAYIAFVIGSTMAVGWVMKKTFF